MKDGQIAVIISETTQPEKRNTMPDVPVIMVVEDDAEMNELQRELLAIHNMDSFPAYTGKEALDLFRQKKVDGILLDIMLPEMDGFETCCKLRHIADNPRLPIIMITAMNESSSIERGYRSGANAFFVKPFSPDEIVQTLRQLLAVTGAGD